MTRKIAISLPDDIADHLRDKPNVSAYVAESIRRRIDADYVHVRLLSVGLELTDDALSTARQEFEAARGAVDDDLRVAAAALHDQVRGSRA
jgi:hypothetical protein